MGQNQNEPVRVILIDDDPLFLNLVKHRLLKGELHRSFSSRPPGVETYTDPARALVALPTQGQCVVLCDHDMPNGTGLDWLPDMISAVDGPVILFTASGSERVAAEAFRQGAADYITKTEFHENPAMVGRAISQALRRHRLSRSFKQLSCDLKNANETLRTNNDRLAEMTETAHRFVDNVAHEFRTPLTVIKEFASLIYDEIPGPINDEQREFLGHIDSSVRDLAQMVDDFLDTSKLRSDRLRIDRQRFEVAELFDELRPTIQSRAKSKGIVLEEALDANLPTVYGDSEKARRALLNLAVNAIKFSPEQGQVRLVAELDDEGDAVVSVHDTGPGLSDEDRAVITERFEQLSSGRKAGKGFGLGLNIARDLIRINMGRLQVESELGQGSVFSFTLPHAEPSHLLDAYWRMLAQSNSDGVSAIRVTLVGPAGSKTLLRDFLTDQSGSHDLVMPAQELDQAERLILSPTREPEAWIRRLTEQWAPYLEECAEPGSRGLLQTSWLGTWSLPEQAHEIAGVVLSPMWEGRTCA